MPHFVGRAETRHTRTPAQKQESLSPDPTTSQHLPNSAARVCQHYRSWLFAFQTLNVIFLWKTALIILTLRFCVRLSEATEAALLAFVRRLCGEDPARF